MTSARTLALARRRDEIVAQIAMERAAIAQNGASLGRFSRIIDKVRDGIQYLKSHPEALLLPAVIIFVSRPRRLLALAISAVGLWRMAQRWRRRIRS